MNLTVQQYVFTVIARVNLETFSYQLSGVWKGDFSELNPKLRGFSSELLETVAVVVVCCSGNGLFFIYLLLFLIRLLVWPQ